MSYSKATRLLNNVVALSSSHYHRAFSNQLFPLLPSTPSQQLHSCRIACQWKPAIVVSGVRTSKTCTNAPMLTGQKLYSSSAFSTQASLQSRSVICQSNTTPNLARPTLRGGLWKKNVSSCCSLHTGILSRNDSCYATTKTYCTAQSTTVIGKHKSQASINIKARIAESADSLTLSVGGEREVVVPWVWLRDHCRCSTCYNSSSNQKNVDNYTLAGLASKATEVDGNRLSITWQDDHLTEYSLQWLLDNFYSAATQPERVLWDGARMNQQPLPSTPYDFHMNSEDGLRNTLENIVKYGFCVVQGAPATEKGTEMVSRRICFIMETVYGGLNTMVSGVQAHADTAYTNQALGAHTDTTYFTVPSGIQVFHCLHHDGEGGKTLLVDGWGCAEKLRHDDPAAFDLLAKTIVPHEYIDGTSYHLYSLGTVLSVDAIKGELIQIRFNPYDRAPLCTVPPADIGRFYQSYDALMRIIRDKSSEFWLKLTPGNILLVDNWRVMHGRSAFTGKRVICGCYLPRDDWTSKARIMGLL